ncbi:thiamine pyrophosphate-dependent dehydrogenase E1 component subunit alpha [Candidatus Manganitrophus noduliformans]|uniref:Thiamine pyrophosphate-dependent dehydrogenase E1 component subunit alpha n=1 Tax=Candidatus Manganitrophus noduliformans TaxID=2606439 RepID=A0A7X6DQW1_9BACT|nr:thiamine pyrophosphate-dependent dehydrogenase E1 component subunit alpha [Candidatus Manganitrophus noduliformans]NKE71685.1 thiamine pyrophosphate-dependent dehydrogenase E1 component subunit alpha [Candidatus Manganitrophus noduliformans]
MENKEDRELYFYLKLTREFEDRVSKLHRQGKILGGVYSGRGQEAIVVGVCYGLRREDFIAPLHRDMGAFLVKGVDPNRLMAQLFGKKTGLSKGKDSFLHAGDLSRGVFGATSMLASTLPVAAGAALKFRMKKESHVAVAFFGEGASSRGDFHEALNFAGIHKLPVLFVCENNFYAYSTPQNMQMAVEDVAIRAEGYGFKGAVCSGNDLHAVMKTAHAAVERAREGEGPTLIECKTYRYHGHSEHDQPFYRPQNELIEWESRDPIQRFEIYLEKKGYNVDQMKADTEREVKAITDEAVRFAEESPWPEGKEAIEDLYANPF